jgi:hypothetical protein
MDDISAAGTTDGQGAGGSADTSLMSTRAGRWSAQQSRELLWDVVVRQRLVLGIGMAAILTFAGLTQIVAHGWWAGFAFAGITTAGLAALSLVVLEQSGNLGAQMGAEAERWTDEELRKLGRRDCVVVSHIPFDKRDVDHALLTSSGAWALETKWTALAWGGLREKRLRDGARGAQRSAQQLGNLLASPDIGVPMSVEPLVVLWGRWGDETLPRDLGVEVVLGSDLRDWFCKRELSTGHLDVRKALDGLDRWLAKRDENIRRKDTRPIFVRLGAAGLGFRALVGILALTAGLLGGALLGGLSNPFVVALAVGGLTIVSLVARPWTQR